MMSNPTPYSAIKRICENLKKNKNGVITYNNKSGENQISVEVVSCKPVIASLIGMYGSTECLGQMIIDILAVSGELNMNISVQAKGGIDPAVNYDFAQIHIEYCGFYAGPNLH
jgi:hypothetical protein